MVSLFCPCILAALDRVSPTRSGRSGDAESGAQTQVTVGSGIMPSSKATEVGRRIALLRRRLGLSQVAFARQARVSRNSLVEYERGERVPKTAPLARIAQAGGSSVDWLLHGRIPRERVRDDPEWEAAVRMLREIWRDHTRRRVAVAMLRTLGQR